MATCDCGNEPLGYCTICNKLICNSCSSKGVCDDCQKKEKK